MQIITYNEALTQICDWFDSVIAPRTIARANTNIIYLIFKAFAKAWEVINNTCVVLNNKFDPANCTDSDLESVAFLVGTERIKGASSGLLVTIVSNASKAKYLPAGTYTYALDKDTSFSATFTADKLVESESSIQITFLSADKGSFPVTSQQDISLTAVDLNGDEITIPDTFSFANADNAQLLGYTDETDLEFRKRIIEDTDRQDVITEIKNKIKSLPYVFDCDIKFNDNPIEQSYDGYVIPPYYMLLMVSGDIKDEIAEIVASKGIYPTVQTDNNSYAVYQNDVFADGQYKVWITPYRKYDFSVDVAFYADANFISATLAEEKIRKGLFNAVNGNRHVDIITENDIFNYINALNIAGIKVLGVNINDPSGSTNKNYITFQKTRIPNLTAVNASPQAIGV